MSAMHRKKWWVLFGIGLMLFLLNIDATVMNIALATLARYFHLPIQMSQWVITIYLLVAAIVLIPSGRIADLSSKRDVYLLGVVFFFVGSWIAACAGEIWVLLLGRALQGLGYGMTMALITVLATLYFPDRDKGRALGVLAILSCLGLAVGPTLGGAIAQFLSWRMIFWMNLPICFLSMIIVLWVCPREKMIQETVSEPLDWRLIKKLFANRAYLILVINRFLILASYGMMLLIVPLYLQNLKNDSPLETGYIMLGMTLAVIIASTGFARWVDKKGYHIFHLSACVLFFIAYLFFIATFYWQRPSFLVLGLICAGLATGSYFVGSVRGALHELPKIHQALGMSIFYASALLGGAVCVSIAGQILHLNAYWRIQAMMAKMSGLSQVDPSVLRSVGSGIQSFYVQNWEPMVGVPLVSLHAMLMKIFSQGLVIIAVFGACLTFIAILLARSVNDRH